MADILIMDWMEEFDSLTESEIHTYSTEQEHNHEVMLALYVVLEDQQKLKSGNVSVVFYVKVVFEGVVVAHRWDMPTISRVLSLRRETIEEICDAIHSNTRVLTSRGYLWISGYNNVFS